MTEFNLTPTNETETETLTSQLLKGNVFAEECVSRKVLQNVTSKWGVLVILALLNGTYRFGDLRRQIAGVSEKMLSQTLHALEYDGFVNRVSFPVVPLRVEYSLTPLGIEIAKKVRDLADWIEMNIETITQLKSRISEN